MIKIDMPRNPPNHLIFITIIICLACLVNSTLSSQQELTELQKQARLYRDEGWQLQRSGDIEQALSFYQKAILVDPNYVVAYNDAAVILETKGRIEEAKELYLKAINTDPNYPNSYSNLALLYESCGDYANAVANWVRRATLGGGLDDPWAQAAKNRLDDIASAHPQAYSQLKEENISLFNRDKKETDFDSSASAAEYLKRAKESFSRGDYVTALREATLAEYLGSSDSEISAFVVQVRKRLLQ